MKLILVGGFLGSGKTTAIAHGAQLLMRARKKVAVITNDQGTQLVDSAFFENLGIPYGEVTGGCFCCRYEQLDAYLRSLEKHEQPDIVFAESVGSCTDLIATVIKPLNNFKPDLAIAISAFADAALLDAITKGTSAFEDESVRYIYKKQLEEADILVLNKVDLLTTEQRTQLHDIIALSYPGKKILHQDSTNEEHVLTWLAMLEQFTSTNVRQSLAIDYKIYGEGESKLAWLDNNLEIYAPSHNVVFITKWMIRSIVDQLQSMHKAIGHLKFFLETATHKYKVSITATTTGTAVYLSIPETDRIKIMINARVETVPEFLLEIVSDVISKAKTRFDCSISVGNWSAFKPGFPRPLHRIAE